MIKRQGSLSGQLISNNVLNVDLGLRRVRDVITSNVDVGDNFCYKCGENYQHSGRCPNS